MNNVENNLLTKKREDLKSDFELFLKVSSFEIEGDTNINEVIKNASKSFKVTYDKDLFDITNVDDFDEIRKEIGYQSINLVEESDFLDEIMIVYRDFLVAYKFAKEWAKPRQRDNDDVNNFALNTIVFGAPGTGKSHCIKDFVNKNKASTTDVTFHPDSDYASFVGCYKPTKGIDESITYDYVPQAFIKAYIKAWQLPKDEIHVLRIEEINRGNCAQIFGDIFQLLDRYEEDSDKGTKGYSKYSVDTDTDIRDFLRTELTGCDFSEIKETDVREAVANGEKLVLPRNLYILATMNTSDQSLYPMDSAFKRRWEWKYIPISYNHLAKYIVTGREDKEEDRTGYSWEEFLLAINKRIFEATKSEDKQLGFWFVGETQAISVSTFVNKVLFYLWNDIFKDFHDESNSPFTTGGIQSFQSLYLPNGIIDTNKVKNFLQKGLNLTEQIGVVHLIKESKQKEDKRISSRSSKIRVVFQDGTIIEERNSDAQILKDVIEYVGADTVKALNIRVSGCPLVSENIEDFKERYRATVNRHQLPQSKMFVFTTSSTQAKIDQLKLIAQKTHLDFDVKDTSSETTTNENPD